MKTDQENNPPSFIERLHSILCDIWCFLLVSPILYLLVAGVAGWLKVQVPLPKTDEMWINVRLGVVLLGFGGPLLYFIFSKIVWLITGEDITKFNGHKTTDVGFVGMLFSLISAAIISFLIKT